MTKVIEFPQTPDKITHGKVLLSALAIHANVNEITALKKQYQQLLQIERYSGRVRASREKQAELKLKLRKTKELITIFTTHKN